MIFRLSKKLSQKPKGTDLPAPPPDLNPFLDWHAHLFMYHRSQHILVCNSESFLPVVLPGAGNASADQFTANFLTGLSDVLYYHGAMLIYEKIIAPNASSITIAKSQNKRIIGSMNDMIVRIKACLDYGESNPFDISLELCKHLVKIDKKYHHPIDLFLNLKIEEQYVQR